MAYLWAIINEHSTINIIYFELDNRKSGVRYISIEGQLQNIDALRPEQKMKQ